MKERVDHLLQWLARKSFSAYWAGDQVAAVVDMAGQGPPPDALRRSGLQPAIRISCARSHC